jgi:uncharacterized protein YlxW (UPF0749 family)
VALLAGLLFTANIRSQPDTDLRDAPGVRGMVSAKDREVRRLTEEQGQLTEQVDQLMTSFGQGANTTDPSLALAAGQGPVRGPGVTVILNDAPSDGPGAKEVGAALSQLLVHQQDIDAVLNALRAGGAEALAVQGQRIVSNTQVRCVGNVILVAGQVYSPPYRIEAIGPADQLAESLSAEPVLDMYRARAARLGLGWDVIPQQDLTVEGSRAVGVGLRYARAGSDTPATVRTNNG